MKLDYIKQLNEFYSMLDFWPISSNAVAVYSYILHVASKLNWPYEFKIANTTLMRKCKLNSSALQRARNELITNNYIRYKKRK